jgi:hypothetical protein
MSRFSAPPDGLSEQGAPDSLHSLGELLTEASFWLPEKFVASAWIEHAPFAFWLIEALAPAKLVELGTHHGFSYLAFCQAVQRLGLGTQCFAVDTWQGDDHAGAYGPEVFLRLLDYHQPRYGAFSSLIRSTFTEALSYIEDGSIDLLHIDGCHRYEDAKADFENWLPKLSDRAVVIFHDTNVRERDFGVVSLWEELRRQYPSFSFAHGHGLGVLGVGEKQGPGLAALFDANPELARRLRLAYGRLGSAIQVQAALTGQDAAFEAVQQERSALLAERNRLAKALTGEKEQLARLRQELLSAKLSAGRAVLESQRLHSDIATVRQWLTQSQQQTRDAQELRIQAEQERAVIVGSTVWRATLPLRAAMNRMPRLRRSAHRLSRLAMGYNGYGGVLNRWRLWRDAAQISASPLFDSAWYCVQYADVTQAGLPPAQHYLRHGAEEGRNPGPRFSTQGYLTRYPDVAMSGLNPLVHFLRFGAAEGRSIIAGPADLDAPPPRGEPPTSSPATAPLMHLLDARVPASKRTTPAGLMLRRFPELEPLPVFTLAGASAKGAKGRLTMVTDSVNRNSLFGGVGTALLMASFLAAERGHALRVVTRTEPAETSGAGAVMRALGASLVGDIEFLHLPPGSDRRLDLREDDLFLTTSWWSTDATATSVGREKVIYLLQDDERLFYAHGDIHLRCAEAMERSAGQVVISTATLREHLRLSGLAALADRAWVFEPAFPESLYYLDPARQAVVESGKERLNFLYYARPHHARNLYVRGLEALESALDEGLIDPRRWIFHFIGEAGEPITLPRRAEIRHVPPTGWAEYAALVRRMDAGLCLMYSPHPSYPPLDLAASGGVAVTNSFGVKQDVSVYSDNILCASTRRDDLAQAIGKAAQLATNWPRRRANYDATRIQRDWQAALAPVIKGLIGAEGPGHG